MSRAGAPATRYTEDVSLSKMQRSTYATSGLGKPNRLSAYGIATSHAYLREL
jgi:hypothetical protein